MANQFEENCKNYLSLFENKLLPLLEGSQEDNMFEVRELDGELDGARTAVLGALNSISDSLEEETTDVLQDEQSLRDADGEIDQVRDRVIEPLNKIVAALDEEQIEADEQFDAVRRTTSIIGTTVSIIGTILGLLIAFFLTRGITKPLNRIIGGLN